MKKKNNSKMPETISETMLRQIKRKKRLRLYRRIKRMLVLMALIAIAVAYFKSDFSKVKSYKINENQFYTEEEILKTANLDLETYFLTPTFVIERKLEENPLIEKAEVKKDFSGQIKIKTTDAKIIGYLSNDTKKVLVQGRGVNTINRYNNLELPRISGLNEEQLAMLDSGFEKVEKEYTFMISEILHHSESYNSNMVMLIMNDGNRIVSGFNGLYLLNNYKAIKPQLTGHQVCLYLDDISGNIIKQTKCGVSAKPIEENKEETSE